eukprot:5602394-Ditylum_brightwellii.AAC.1
MEEGNFRKATGNLLSERTKKSADPPSSKKKSPVKYAQDVQDVKSNALNQCNPCNQNKESSKDNNDEQKTSLKEKVAQIHHWQKMRESQFRQHQEMTDACNMQEK